MNIQLPSGYQLRNGSRLDRSQLVKFMQQTYRELFPDEDFSHLAETVDRYLSKDTPLWWVVQDTAVVGCLWLGNALDLVNGSRYAHIFLLYVIPQHRRLGIGTALMKYAETWAKTRGDRQIGLQVFQNNQNALRLYHHLGFQTQSLLMIKPLYPENNG